MTITEMTITGRGARHCTRRRTITAPRLIGRTVQRAVTATVLLFVSLVSASAEAQPVPDRAGVVAAIEAYRDVSKKITQSEGPFKNWAGFYSRGARCEWNEKTAARPPGMWEKGQFVLWTDAKYLYGMQLDASPAVFQYEYTFFKNVIGMDIYQLTRVDTLGPAAGVDDAEWRLLGIGVPNPEDTGRIGIRITPQFLALPDVHELGWLTYCGPGGAGYHQEDPVEFSIQFLERRLAAMPK
jgi:hypothetical protein